MRKEIKKIGKFNLLDEDICELKCDCGWNRSLSQLNTDRHLFVKKMEEILKEQREDIVEKIKENSTDSANLFGEAILIEDITKLIKQ